MKTKLWVGPGVGALTAPTTWLAALPGRAPSQHHHDAADRRAADRADGRDRHGRDPSHVGAAELDDVRQCPDSQRRDQHEGRDQDFLSAVRRVALVNGRCPTYSAHRFYLSSY